MIDGDIKKKLLDEIRKFGNVYLSCLKVGVNRATYYRWRQKDKMFRVKAKEAERLGRENICDVAEHCLMQNVKGKNQRAIEYTLSHNSERYKQKQTSNVIILHKKDMPPPAPKGVSMLDLLSAIKEDKITEIKEKYEAMGGIPPKADGSKIEDRELEDYELYIEEWYKNKKMENEAADENSIDTVGSESALEKPPAMPQENQTPEDISGSDPSIPSKKRGSNT